MLDYFSDETENGKLYINYPMIESLKYTKEIPDANYRPNDRLRSLSFFLGLTVRKDLVAPFGCDYKGVVVTGLYAVIDADIPVPQRFPDTFDLSLDALFDGGEDYPGGGARESAGCALLLNIYAQIVDDITGLGGGDYILFDNMAIIQENDYIST